MTILVADDNTLSRELIRELLESSSNVILEASNGREALELIRSRQPDLVFLDLQMPVHDGFRVIREIRNDERFHKLSVIAITASAMMGDRERAISAGFDSYIVKPIDLCAVEAQVKAVAARSRQ